MDKLHKNLIEEKLKAFEKGAEILDIRLEDIRNIKYPDYLVKCRDFHKNLITIRARIMNNIYCEMRIVQKEKTNES